MNNRSYPREVKAVEVVNSIFGPSLFMLPGGRAVYDEVWMADGGSALYLCRLEAKRDGGLRVGRRWIPWNTTLLQMYEK